MNEVSIIINGVRYDAVEMTEEETSRISCELGDLNYRCKCAKMSLDITCAYILGMSRYFKKSTKSFER